MRPRLDPDEAPRHRLVVLRGLEVHHAAGRHVRGVPGPRQLTLDPGLARHDPLHRGPVQTLLGGPAVHGPALGGEVGPHGGARTGEGLLEPAQLADELRAALLGVQHRQVAPQLVPQPEHVRQVHPRPEPHPAQVEILAAEGDELADHAGGGRAALDELAVLDAAEAAGHHAALALVQLDHAHAVARLPVTLGLGVLLLLDSLANVHGGGHLVRGHKQQELRVVVLAVIHDVNQNFLTNFQCVLQDGRVPQSCTIIEHNISVKRDLTTILCSNVHNTTKRSFDFFDGALDFLLHWFRIL